MNTTKQVIAAEIGIVDLEEEFDNALSEFRLLSTNAIPIPPTIGDRFAGFFDDGMAIVKDRHIEWKKNIETFQSDNVTAKAFPVENIVRTTVESLVDYSYMRNPHAELTASNKEDKQMAKHLQKALQVIINKKTKPGINLRPKMLKQIVKSHLTNFGVLELTYQDEKGSVEQVFKTNELTKQQIKEEQDPEKAGPLYALLDILQRELDTRKHAGIGVRARSPFSLLIDPDCEELDLSDAKWCMDRDYMRIDHIKAEYMTFDAEQEKYFFKYDNNVELDVQASIVSQTKEATEQSIVEDIMPDVDTEQARIRAKGTVAIVWVYDRTTRLKYLYMEGRWDTPLWVYEDEMELSRFFPFFILAFSTPLNSIYQQGEVAHYKPFQDEINAINAQVSAIRRRGFSRYIYNATAVDKEEADKFFRFTEDTDPSVKAIGIKVRDADFKSLSDLFEPLKLPAAQFKEIFDKSDLRETAARTTRISEAQTGGQFKTNTTNDAVATYNDVTNTRTESLTDKIEAVVEDLLWAISELLVSKTSQAQMAQLLTAEEAATFKSMSVEAFNQQYNLTLAAGSIEKPTSTTKKREAVQIIQMLGQFPAAPRTVLSIVARLLRSAFSRNLVTDEDLKKLEEEGQAAMQKGISTQGQQKPPQTKGM